MNSIEYRPVLYQSNRPLSNYNIKNRGYSQRNESIVNRLEIVQTDLLKEVSIVFYCGKGTLAGNNGFYLSESLGDNPLNTHSATPVSPINATHEACCIQVPFVYSLININQHWIAIYTPSEERSILLRSI
jgi:hypothetical protein